MDAYQEETKHLHFEQHSKYKEENEELKKDVETLHQVCEKYSRGDSYSHRVLREENQKHIIEIHKLRKENERLQKVMEMIGGVIKLGVD